MTHLKRLGKNCQILSNVVCEDFVACNIRVDSELCITRAEKFGLKNKFDNNQLKKAQSILEEKRPALEYNKTQVI